MAYLENTIPNSTANFTSQEKVIAWMGSSFVGVMKFVTHFWNGSPNAEPRGKVGPPGIGLGVETAPVRAGSDAFLEQTLLQRSVVLVAFSQARYLLPIEMLIWGQSASNGRFHVSQGMAKPGLGICTAQTLDGCQIFLPVNVPGGSVH